MNGRHLQRHQERTDEQEDDFFHNLEEFAVKPISACSEARSK
jgi:hypothetical protein